MVGWADWDREDMRSDILWWAHFAQAPHPKCAGSQERAMSVAWWPGIEAQMSELCKWCALCKPPTVERVGLGSFALRAFQVVQMDDKKIPLALKEKGGSKITYVSVLVFTCVASGVVVFCPRSNMSALSAAILLFTQWIRRYGVMAVLVSDNASEYVSEMMTCLCEL